MGGGEWAQISSEVTRSIEKRPPIDSSASKRRQQVAMGDSPWNTINRRRSREAATGEGSAGSLGGGVADSEIDVRCRLFEAAGSRGTRVHGLSPMATRCRRFAAEEPRTRASQ